MLARVLPVLGFLAVLIALTTLGLYQVRALGPDLRNYLALSALFVGLVTFLLNAWFRQLQDRKQFTLKILFDSRLSAEFRQMLAHRKLFFDEGEQVSWDVFQSYLKASRDKDLSEEEALKRRQCAEAIRSLLNYYEFLALGIDRGDLDKDLLYGSIRGILCNLVVDMRDIIETANAKNDKTFDRLIWLYNQWRDPEQPKLGG